MRKDIIKRVIKLADYIISTNLTIREVSKLFMISKSTVHKDIKERHINGGKATQQLFLRKKQVTL